MLFTEYLKNSQKQYNKPNQFYKPNQTLNINQPQNNHRILYKTQNTHSIGKLINNTISPQAHNKFQSETEISNPLKRLKQRKERAKSRSRSPSIISTNRTSQQIILFPNKYYFKSDQKTFLGSDLKLCISCDNFIKQSDIQKHEKICEGFDGILRMSKNDLLIYVESKKTKNLMIRNQLVGRLNKVNNNMQVKIQLACKIAQLQKKIEYYNIVRGNIKGMLTR